MRKDIIFWIVGALLLIFTLTGMGYAATFLFSKSRVLQEDSPLTAEPVRFNLLGIDELGISNIDPEQQSGIDIPGE